MPHMVKCTAGGKMKDKKKMAPSPEPPHPPPPPPARPAKKPRELKEWADIGPTQRWQRLKEVLRFMRLKKVPLSALFPSAPPAANLLHLTTAERKKFRTVEGTSLPSEKLIIKLREELAETHGTATKSITHNNIVIAYLSDPLRFINTVTTKSEYIAIGGDCGSNITKLGITYTNNDGDEEFAALLVMNKSDDWESLSELCHINITKYTGDSRTIPTIWGIFQSLLFTHSQKKKIFLNGDWKFLNTVLGLKSPSSSFPCPICLVPHTDLLLPSPPRNLAAHLSDEYSASHVPLIAIGHEYIVPTPLHLFLGICNRIIRKVLAALWTDEGVKEAMAEVKSIHSHSAGAAAVHELNGAEWIRLGLTLAFSDPTSPSPIAQLDVWMNGLLKHLLHKENWSEEEKNNFRSLVFDIQMDWKDATGTRVIPKVHMLTHAVQFVEKHGHLGKFGEARIESYHATFNQLFSHNHRNMAHVPEEQLRRTLAETSLHAVQMSE